MIIALFVVGPMLVSSLADGNPTIDTLPANAYDAFVAEFKLTIANGPSISNGASPRQAVRFYQWALRHLIAEVAIQNNKQIVPSTETAIADGRFLLTGVQNVDEFNRIEPLVHQAFSEPWNLYVSMLHRTAVVLNPLHDHANDMWSELGDADAAIVERERARFVRNRAAEPGLIDATLTKLEQEYDSWKNAVLGSDCNHWLPLYDAAIVKLREVLHDFSHDIELLYRPSPELAALLVDERV